MLPLGGVFLLQPAGQQPAYVGSTANGVTSLNYGPYEGLRLLPCGVPLEVVIREHELRNKELMRVAHAKVRLLPPMTSGATGTRLCSEESNYVMSRSNGLVVQCVGRTCQHQGLTVWGSGPYTTDSGVCAAARHAGVVGPDGGMFRIDQGADLTGYVGSTARGVTTLNWVGSWQSMVIVPVTSSTEEALQLLRTTQASDLARVRAALSKMRTPSVPEVLAQPIPSWGTVVLEPALEITCLVSLRVPAVALLEPHIRMCARENCVVQLAAEGITMLSASSRIQVLNASLVGCDYIGTTSLMFVSTACRVVLHFNTGEDRRRLAVQLRRGQDVLQLPQPIVARALTYLDDTSLLAASRACRWFYAASRKVLSDRLSAADRIWVRPNEHGIRIEVRLRERRRVERPKVAFIPARQQGTIVLGQLNGHGHGAFAWPLVGDGGIYAPVPDVEWGGDTRAVLYDSLALAPFAVSPPFLLKSRPAMVLGNRVTPLGPIVPGKGLNFEITGTTDSEDLFLFFCSSVHRVFVSVHAFQNTVMAAVLPLAPKTEYGVCLVTACSDDFATPESCTVVTTSACSPGLSLSVSLEGGHLVVSYEVPEMMILPFVALFPCAGTVYVGDSWQWIVNDSGVAHLTLPELPGIPLEVRLYDVNGVVLRQPILFPE